jgi:putative membrane protein
MKKQLLPALLVVACGAVFAADNAQLDKKDREFIEKAAVGGMAEVEIGNLAQQKAQNADAKQFGSMLSTDHTAANNELKTLAQNKGVALPTTLSKKEQKRVEKLEKSKHFDKDFAKDGVKDHKHDIKDFEKEAKDGKDPDVKAFAAKAIPVLQKHLQAAEQLEKAVKSQKG